METLNPQMTQLLGVLLAVPAEGRDDTWCGNFLNIAPTASLASFDPQIQNGPDTFPYFQLAMPDAGAFTPFSIVHILEDCIENGVGAVIHTSMRREGAPAWVFTLGDLVSYKLFQDFNGDPKVYKNPDPPPADDVDRSILRAVPNDSYIPAGARAAMGRFMRGPYQHPDPRIGLVSGASLRPRQSLMVNLRRSHYDGDMTKIDAAMNYLTWFIPKSYSIMPLPDDWSDEEMLPI
jgi:hypothetical protein